MVVPARAVLCKALVAVLRVAECGTKRVVVVVTIAVAVDVTMAAAAEVVTVVSGTIAHQNAQRIGTHGDEIYRQQNHRYDPPSTHP